MRSKRYFAQDLRSAVLKVRQELGPNAIILAHHRLASGIEVTAIPGKDTLEIARSNSDFVINKETLDVKDVRESFDSTVESGVQFNSSENDEKVKGTVTPKAGVTNSAVHDAKKQDAIKGKQVADREKIFSVGDSIMHDKTRRSSQQKTTASADKTAEKKIETVEYDFEAEMNTILNTHYVSLAANQVPAESRPALSQASKSKSSESIKSKQTSQASAKTRKTSTSSKKSRTKSKVHTALDGLKINTQKKQTVIRSSSQDLPLDAVPPLLMRGVNHDELIESIELRIGEHAYGDNARKNPVKAALIRQLMKLDLSPVIIQNVVDMLVSDKIDQKMLLPQAMAIIANQIPIYKEDITSIGGTIALFGATGVGKTTTIAKLAARYALRHGAEKVALITTDNNRIAATEQLRSYSNILGLPLRIAKNDIEVLNALNTFSEKEFVLIDTAGMNPKEIKQSKFYELFAGGITQIKKFQVLPATMHRTALEKISASFRDLSPDGSIITKVDETTSLGGAISVAIQNHLPIAFYGDGQTVPDDFHLARAHILMSRVASVAVQFDDLESDGVNDQFTPGIASNVSF